jgi:hypothetical protein
MVQNAKKHFLPKCLIGSLLLVTTSCGTLLYPERRGQPAGRLDAGVVVLDAVGLLCFFIPGVVAFAVDFSNGTIYLPPDPISFSSPPDSQHLQKIQVDPADLTPQRLLEILGEQTGRPIRLQPGTYRAARISDIEEFAPITTNRLQSAAGGTTVVFRGTSE